jgi:hypothetical protein
MIGRASMRVKLLGVLAQRYSTLVGADEKSRLPSVGAARIPFLSEPTQKP